MAVSLTIGLGSLAMGAASISQQRSAQKDTKRANRVAQRKAELEEARSRRQTVARSRTLRAQTEAQGEQSGVGGGSGVQGAMGSLQTQTASAIGFSNQISDFNTAIGGFQQRAANHMGRAGNLAAGASMLGGLQQSGLFDKPKPVVTPSSFQ